MAELHGKDVAVYIGGYQLSTMFRESTASMEADLPDRTTYQDDSMEYAPGTLDGAITLDGLYSFDETGVTLDKAAEVLFGALGAGEKAWTLLYENDAVGAVGRSAMCLENSYEVEAPTDDLISVAAEGQGNRGVQRSRVAQPWQAVVAGGNSASHDDGAAPTTPSTRGGAGFLQVGDVGNGCTLTVKIQHSSDNSVWVDLITFAAIVGGAGVDRSSQRVETALPTTQVNRYIRALWTMVGGTLTATFRADFARHIS